MKDREDRIRREMKFSYVLEDVAGCIGPLSTEHLAYLKRQGITGIVRMAEADMAAVTRQDIEAAGLRDFREPVTDWTAPTQGQIDQMLGFVKAEPGQGGRVAVSCGAGKGRTGTVLACHLVANGMTVEDAIAFVRSKRPGSVEERRPSGESTGQREAITEFERRLRPRKVPHGST